MFNFSPVARTLALSILVLGSTAIAEQPAEAADPGVQAVTEAASTPYTQPAEVTLSAEEQLQEYMISKGWNEGWDTEKKRMFVVYSESFDVEDPSYDTDFIEKRSLYATMAVMGAKATIVEFMRTEMSAMDMLTIPGNDVHEELNQKYNQLQRKITAQQQALIKLMEEVDATEAQQLAGVTWDDLSKEMMASMIKKLDSSFDQGQLAADKAAQYEKAKSRYEEATAELEQLQAQAKELSGAVRQTAGSSVETLAKAPLLGATLLTQAESWDAESEQYQVAVLLVWSEQLESAASSILAGTPQKRAPREGMTVGDWARKQDLSIMVGPRQFIDQDGERWFIGAYGALLEGSSSAQRAARGRADLFARKEAAVALFADLETQKQAEMMAQTRNSGELGSKDNTVIATSFAETTRQSIENRQISGLSKIAAKKVKHGISGHDLYVVIYGISAQSAVSALQAEAQNYASAVEAARNNTQQANYKAGLEQQLDAASDTSAKAAPPPPADASAPAPVESGNTGGSSSSGVLFSEPEINDDDF